MSRSTRNIDIDGRELTHLQCKCRNGDQQSRKVDDEKDEWTAPALCVHDDLNETERGRNKHRGYSLLTAPLIRCYDKNDTMETLDDDDAIETFSR